MTLGTRRALAVAFAGAAAVSGLYYYIAVKGEERRAAATAKAPAVSKPAASSVENATNVSDASAPLTNVCRTFSTSGDSAVYICGSECVDMSVTLANADYYTVTAVNTCAERELNVTRTVKFYDAAGYRLGTQLAFIGSMDAGEKVKERFKINSEIARPIAEVKLGTPEPRYKTDWTVDSNTSVWTGNAGSSK